MRISVDYRSQGIPGAIVEDGLEPHHRRLAWDQIYPGWTRPELMYCWRNLPLNTVQRDRFYHQNAAPR